MRWILGVSGLLALAACLDNSGPEDAAVARLEIVGDTLLSGLPGDTLAGELRVLATDHRGEPLRGIEVTWSTSDGGSFAPAVAPTIRDGIARTRWRLGIAPGAQTAGAAVLGLEPLRLEASAVGFTAARLSTGTGPHTCALDDGGSAFCWGSNRGGELGDGTTNDSEIPVPVAGDLTFSQIITGQGFQFAGFTCGLATSGEVYCWGSNSGRRARRWRERFDASRAGSDRRAGGNAFHHALIVLRRHLRRHDARRRVLLGRESRWPLRKRPFQYGREHADGRQRQSPVAPGDSRR